VEPRSALARRSQRTVNPITRLKSVAKKTPGAAAVEELKDIDWVISTYYEGGLEIFAKRDGQNIQAVVFVIDSESSGKLGGLYLVQLLHSWIRFDPPHNYALHVKNGINHAGLRGHGCLRNK
jgi:hypothetical protein